MCFFTVLKSTKLCSNYIPDQGLVMTILSNILQTAQKSYYFLGFFLYSLASCKKKKNYVKCHPKFISRFSTTFLAELQIDSEYFKDKSCHKYHV